jgi:hypothetical protein
MQEENQFYPNPFLGTADSNFKAGGGIDRPFVCAPGLECKDIGRNTLTCVDPNESIKSLSVPRMEWETCGENLPCDDGLVCTGTNIEVLPNTCVVPRAPDVCYAGPWWNAIFCPRTGILNNVTIQEPPCGGMSPEMAFESLLTILLMSPGEINGPGQCNYWTLGDDTDYTPATNNSGWAVRNHETRQNLYNVFGE